MDNCTSAHKFSKQSDDFQNLTEKLPYIYIYIYIYISVTGMKIRLGKRYRAFIVLGVLVMMLADAQTNINSSHAHVQWFSCWKIRAHDHDITRISHAIEGGNYKRRALPNLGAVI